MNIKIGEFILVNTCEACPEQYDVYKKEVFEHNLMGYIRLRWGILTLEYPYVGGEMLYIHDFYEEFKGIFNNNNERDDYLFMVICCLNTHIQNKGV